MAPEEEIEDPINPKPKLRSRNKISSPFLFQMTSLFDKLINRIMANTITIL
jgi:hypothetical protein